MRFTWVVGVLVSVCLGSVTACATTSPVGPSPLNLAGTWTGTLARVDNSAFEPQTLRITSWTATQTGADVTGRVVFEGQHLGEFIGFLSGTVAGNQLVSATMTILADTIPPLPMCSFTGTGTPTATMTSISGTLAMTFAGSCVAPASDGTWTGTYQLSLTR